MTDSQKLQLRASEIRNRLNTLAGLEGDALTDELRAEVGTLTTEYRDVEVRTQAAIVAEDGERKAAELANDPGSPDAETRALQDLQGRTTLGRFLQCFSDGEPLSGAEKELTETRGLSTSGNVLPFDALLPPARRSVELRADAVSPAPASGNPVNQSEIIQRVFARTALARLGVAMPSVGVGQASYPLISIGQDAAFVAKDGLKEAEAGAITPNLLGPVRLQARVQFRIEDSFDDMIPAPKKPRFVPVVLSPEEVVQFLDGVKAAKHHAILTTCYAAGLRISEAVHLTVSAIDSARMVLRIAKGKGQKDRYVMLSPKLLAILRTWWKVDRPRHWLFPGERPETPITRAAVQRACQIAARRARLAKPVSPHALRNAST